MVNKLRTFISMSLGFTILIVLLRYVDLNQLVSALKSANLTCVALAAIPLALTYLLRGWRWQLLLTPIMNNVISVKSLTQITVIGFFVNLILPFRAGEVMRALLLRRIHTIGLIEGFTSIAIERFLDLITLLGLATFSFAIATKYGAPATWVLEVLRAIGIITAALFLFIILTAFYENATRKAIQAIIFRAPMPIKLKHKALSIYESYAKGLLSVRSPKLFGPLILSSLAIWLCLFTVYSLSFTAFNVNLPLNLMILGSTTVAILSIIPMTPGQMGTFELLWLLAFTSLGIPADKALAAAIILRVLTLIFLTIATLTSITTLNLKLNGLLHPKEKNLHENRWNQA